MSALSLDFCRGRLVSNVGFHHISRLQQDSGTFAVPIWLRQRQRRSLSSSSYLRAEKRQTPYTFITNSIVNNKLQSVAGSCTSGAKDVWQTLSAYSNKYTDGTYSKLLDTLHVDIPNSVKRCVNKIPEFLSKQQDVHQGTNKTSGEKLGVNDTVSLHASASAAQMDLGKVVQDTPYLQASVAAEFNDDAKDEPPQEKLVDHSLIREQHDFESAMTSKYNSVHTYYSESKLPCNEKNKDISKCSIEKELTKAVLEDLEAMKTKSENEKRKELDQESPKSSTTAQKILHTAGASLSGSQNVISDVVKRFPKIPYIIPQRKELPNKQQASAVDAKVKTPVKTIPRIPRIVQERKTRELTLALKRATKISSKLIRLEDFCKHLKDHPETRGIAVQENIIPVLLKMREVNDCDLHQQSNQALAMLGYINPVKGRGIKILSLDGGGTKGLYTLELLRQLEQTTGKRIYEMFDLICGVSTGALLATMLAAVTLSVDQCEAVYKEFSKEVFSQRRIPGITKLIMSHAYYDSNKWEKLLRLNVGDSTYLDSMKIASNPKLVTVSSIINSEKIENFVFRNYEYPTGRSSRYTGSLQYALWEAVRASSAAPGYYEDYKLGEHIHMDGGILSNNPTAIALHEAKLLWPNDSVQCVVSIGTGRFQPAGGYKQVQSSSLPEKLKKIVQSATDTEGVHTTLHDLLPPETYFRFNPYMSEDFLLDEIRDEKWDQMYRDTQMYCHKNEAKFKSCAKQLLLEKSLVQKASDLAKLHRDKYYTILPGHDRPSSKM